MSDRIPEAKKWQINSSGQLKLGQRPTTIQKLYTSDEDYEGLLSSMRKQISKRQDILYADARHSFVVLFQGMDTSGKDGVIKHVMSCLNPQGVQVTSFGVPSADEMKRDFIWRAHNRLPPRGKIAIFNRSYYEEVLAPRVQPELLEKQNLPAKPSGAQLWRERYEDIRNFELYLARQGFHIVKIFLHLSKEEQRKRLLSRIDDPEKNWKFDPSDLKARASWAKYQRAYQDCIASTCSRLSPWYVVPADDKKNARLLVSRILWERIRDLPLRFPQLTEAKRRELLRLRKELV